MHALSKPACVRARRVRKAPHIKLRPRNRCKATHLAPVVVGGGMWARTTFECAVWQHNKPHFCLSLIKHLASDQVTRLALVVMGSVVHVHVERAIRQRRAQVKGVTINHLGVCMAVCRFLIHTPGICDCQSGFHHAKLLARPSTVRCPMQPQRN